MEKNLKKDFENAVDAYLKAFCEMYELQYDEDCWVGREHGTVAEVGDYFLGFDDIRRCVDEGYEWDEVLEWYDYCVEAGMYGIDTPNLKSWMMGCPHLNGPEMERIRAASRRVEEAKDALEAEIMESFVFVHSLLYILNIKQIGSNTGVQGCKANPAGITATASVGANDSYL